MPPFAVELTEPVTDKSPASFPFATRFEQHLSNDARLNRARPLYVLGAQYKAYQCPAFNRDSLPSEQLAALVKEREAGERARMQTA